MSTIWARMEDPVLVDDTLHLAVCSIRSPWGALRPEDREDIIGWLESTANRLKAASPDMEWLSFTLDERVIVDAVTPVEAG